MTHQQQHGQYAQYSRWNPVDSVSQIPFQPYQHPTGLSKESIVPSIKTVDVDVPSYRQKSFNQRWFGGVEFTLRAAAAITFVVLILNIGVLVWAQKRIGISSGYGTLQEGDCESAKQLDLWIHLGISAVSTLVLWGSNAFMQTYSAPSRNEIDEAHRRKKWLHVGVLSFRNLRHVAKRKAFVVVLLALSSIPLYLV